MVPGFINGGVQRDDGNRQIGSVKGEMKKRQMMPNTLLVAGTWITQLCFRFADGVNLAPHGEVEDMRILT
jgi:hypothetical protein